MIGKRKAGITLVLLLLLALAAAGGPPSAPDVRLVRIAKASSDADLAAVLNEAEVLRKDLAGCWLALVPDGAIADLTARGVPIEILDPMPEGNAHFLVRTTRPADLDVLRARGSAFPVDGDTALFWAGDSEAREILPSRFKIARLRLVRGPAPRAGAAVVGLPDGGQPAPSAADPVVAALVARVSKADLTASIGDLQNFQTRYASTASCEAAGAYLYAAFARLGLATEYDSFTFNRSRSTSRNIVATLPGKVDAGRVVIVCGHYDSYSNQASTLAPGADDNGSGAAAVLAIAGILAGQELSYTVKFICFSAEEWGLYGSDHYAQAAKAAGLNILGVLNLDMIAYGPSSPASLDIITNSGSSWLADQYLAAASLYTTLGAKKLVFSSWDYSDQSPFWSAGFSALCGIEMEEPDNPYYHTTKDTLSTLNMDYGTIVTKASLATVAVLAKPVAAIPPVPPVAPPSGLRARMQIVSSLYAGVKTVVLDWTASAGTVAGYNVYRSDGARGSYVKRNSAPLTGLTFRESFLDPATSYYYVVTAVDAQGRESAYSNEVRDDGSAPAAAAAGAGR